VQYQAKHLLIASLTPFFNRAFQFIGMDTFRATKSVLYALLVLKVQHILDLAKSA